MNPSFFFSATAKALRTVCCCQPVSSTITAMVAPLCGDDFWDAFITCPEILHTYQEQMAFALQNDVGNAWESFRFAGVTWHKYRGTNDNSTVAIAAKKAKFFPAGAPIFQIAHPPAERIREHARPGDLFLDRSGL